MLDNPKLHASEAGLQAGFKSQQMGPEWVRRFNKKGLVGWKTGPDQDGNRPMMPVCIVP
jgi:hypothetical protein